MGKYKYIDSLKNSTIREVTAVKEKSRSRKKTGHFVVEGQREIAMALKGDFQLLKIFCDPSIIPTEEVESLLEKFKSTAEIIEVSRDVYRRIAYREKTEGMVALGVSKSHNLSDLELKNSNPLILVAEAPEKPGNMGALFRTADAAALDAVIIANPKTDLYNPNIIRASLGCIFNLPIAIGSNSEVLSYLKGNRIAVIAAELNADNIYSKLDYRSSTAIVVGAESSGLTKEWIEEADQRVIIPMRGEIDSMNVSVSAAILIFEAMRQRNFE